MEDHSTEIGSEEEFLELGRAGRIQALAARLEEANVLWDEVEAYVSEFPGWLNLVRMWRYPTRTTNSRVVHMGSPLQYTVVPKETRLRLLGFFRPFALLLDETQTPGARALALREAGIDVMAFCKEHRRDGIPEIAASTDAIFQAVQSDRTLLRSSASPATSNELLHPASDSEVSADGLLLPSDTPPEETPAVQPGWLKRLFSRRSP